MCAQLAHTSETLAIGGWRRLFKTKYQMMIKIQGILSYFYNDHSGIDSRFYSSDESIPRQHFAHKSIGNKEEKSWFLVIPLAFQIIFQKCVKRQRKRPNSSCPIQLSEGGFCWLLLSFFHQQDVYPTTISIFETGQPFTKPQ